MQSTISTIAKYERKILMRSWFFRIFAVLSLFIVFSFNMGEISEVGDMRWAYRAVPSNFPYASLYILNIAQGLSAILPVKGGGIPRSINARAYLLEHQIRSLM